MKRISSIVGATIAVATVGALVAPAAGAVAMDHKNWNSSKGTLTVCVVGIGDREADVEVEGRSDRDAELDNRECASWKLKKGTYTVSQDETKKNRVARTIVRGPGHSWDTSRDNEVRVSVRGGKTTTVVFVNHRERDRFQGGHCMWCEDDD